MDAILAPLRAQGVQLLNYLDDWLVCVQSKEQLAQHTVMVTVHLQRLGLKVNSEKSRQVPSQQTEFLGPHLDSVSMEATLSTQSVQRCLSLFRLRETVSMELCQRMLGLMAAASQALPSGLLHQRPLQAWFNALTLHPRRDKHRRLRVSRTCWEALRWWKVPSNRAYAWVPSSEERLLRPTLPTRVGEQSGTGWGLAECGQDPGGRPTSMLWNSERWTSPFGTSCQCF